MIDYAIPKGFCKKLYDENQLLKHLFIPSYICFDGMKMDASNERKTSINFTYGESPFKELGLEDDVIIYTYNVYKVLEKGRQKVMYLRAFLLECRRGKRNSWCSGEMHRYQEEHRRRRRLTGL